MQNSRSPAVGAAQLAEIERGERDFILNVIHDLAWLKCYAAQRLRGQMACESGSRREVEAWWGCLAVAERELRWWTAAYYLMSFGAAADRFDFCFGSDRRQETIDRILLAGGFLDDVLRFVEVPL